MWSYCNDSSHRIRNCPEFQNLDMDGRWKAVRQKNLCRTCFIPHRRPPSRSKKECGEQGCRIRHHALLQSFQTPANSPIASMSSNRTVYQHHHSNQSYLFFRYIPVTIYRNGKRIDIFAFLIASHLGIEGPVSSLRLASTSNITREEKGSKRIGITTSGKGLLKKFAIENVQTVEGLELPKQSMDYEVLVKQFPYLRGLPIKNYVDVKPQMIIGLERVRLLAAQKLREQ